MTTAELFDELEGESLLCRNQEFDWWKRLEDIWADAMCLGSEEFVQDFEREIRREYARLKAKLP